MKKKVILLAGVVLLVASAVVAAPALVKAVEPLVSGGLTLKECYAMALKRSETIAMQQELINETEAIMLQSLSTALPKIAFAYSQKWQDTGAQSLDKGYTPEAKFTLTQPLFTGFREMAAIGASKHLGKQRAAELTRAQQLLFTDVADAFYLYLSYQQDEEVVAENRSALLARVEELKKREVIGKSKTSEVANAEAKLSRTEAGLESVRAQKEVAGFLIEFLVGQPVTRLVEEDLAPQETPVGELYAKADTRPDVVALKEFVGSMKNNVTAARSGLLPNVTLTGNSYTKRSDAYEGNDWDATVTLNVPIFNGTTDIGLVRQARAQQNAAELKWEQAKRKALMEIKVAHGKYVAFERRLKAFDKAVIAAEENYRLQVQDFKNSLVNNLDVLQALEDRLAVQREQVAAKTDAGRAYWGLKVATGELGQ